MNLYGSARIMGVRLCMHKTKMNFIVLFILNERDEFHVYSLYSLSRSDAKMNDPTITISKSSH